VLGIRADDGIRVILLIELQCLIDTILHLIVIDVDLNDWRS
jgi:hypothetical protein